MPGGLFPLGFVTGKTRWARTEVPLGTSGLAPGPPWSLSGSFPCWPSFCRDWQVWDPGRGVDDPRLPGRPRPRPRVLWPEARRGRHAFRSGHRGRVCSGKLISLLGQPQWARTRRPPDTEGCHGAPPWGTEKHPVCRPCQTLRKGWLHLFLSSGGIVVGLT